MIKTTITRNTKTIAAMVQPSVGIGANCNKMVMALLSIGQPMWPVNGSLIMNIATSTVKLLQLEAMGILLKHVWRPVGLLQYLIFTIIGVFLGGFYIFINKNKYKPLTPFFFPVYTPPASTTPTPAPPTPPPPGKNYMYFVLTIFLAAFLSFLQIL